MAIAPSTAPTQPLSFPALTYAKLSPSPFLLAHLLRPTPLRPNTRLPPAFRPLTVHTGSLTHTHGSAVVRIGDTAVVCGVRGEILNASDAGNDGLKDSAADRDEDRDADTLAALGLLVPNVELETGCSPAHLPGGPPSAAAQSLAHRVLTLLHTSRLLSLPQLQITSPIASTPASDTAEDAPPPEMEAQQPKAFWTLYIDMLFLSLDGCAFDAAWAAALAALQSTRLPRAWWDADAERVFCSPVRADAISLQLRGCPVPSSFGVFEDKGGGEKDGAGAWILADPDAFEEELCAERVTVVVDAVRGKVLRVEKSGGGVVGVKEMRECVEMAWGRAREWTETLGKGREER